MKCEWLENDPIKRLQYEESGTNIGDRKESKMQTKCKCSFVIPLRIQSDNTSRFGYFKQSIESLLKQTDPDWTAVLVDDDSNNEELDDYIQGIMEKCPGHIILHKNPENVGAGIARNIGVDIAAREFNADVIMFQDSDDLSHPERTEKVSRAFATKNIDVLYAPFIPIDENGNPIPENRFPYNIRNIMNNNKQPSVGKEVWKSIVSKEMYINLTSTTNVRTILAQKIPFPNMRSSEDSITWMLYSASGGVFDFIKEIPSRYRIPQIVKNNSLSTEFGKEIFFSDFAEAHIKAYVECLKYARTRQVISEEEIQILTEQVFYNLANELKGGGMYDLAEKYLRKKEEFVKRVVICKV